MPLPSTDPLVSVKNLIKTNWIPGNVVGTTTPDVHTGWWNPKSLAAQITVSGKSESFEGASGYNAIEGGGGGPVQIVNGVMFANCWAYRNEGVAGPNPKQLVYDMAEEIRRIILANYAGITGLDYVSVISTDDVPPEEGRNPMVFRKAVTIGFKWRTT